MLPDVEYQYYRSSTSVSMDANQGFPIVIATDKPIKITQLAVFSITNTANATMGFGIIPAGAERIGGTPNYQMDQVDFFALGILSSSVGPSTPTSPLTAVGIPTKGQFSEIIVPPGGILVAYAVDIALNGNLGMTATGYCYA